jgi:hypothetical protein
MRGLGKPGGLSGIVRAKPVLLFGLCVVSAFDAGCNVPSDAVQQGSDGCDGM